MAQQTLGNDHPLLLELRSLKSAVTRFQDEAHASAVRFQRHSLDSAALHEHAIQLERENALLKVEIALLRANPHPDAAPSSHPAVSQVQQLTLSLRRLSDKLSLTEEALLVRTTELAHANVELVKARLAADSAYEVGARVRGREEAGKVRERDLEWRLKAAEEERNMSDVAVSEYANLVRSLETKWARASSDSDSKSQAHVVETSVGPSITLADSLLEGKLGLKRLLSEFQSEAENLHSQLGQANRELEIFKGQLDAEKKGTDIVHVELAKSQTELAKFRLEDNTAARMVSRYMQFSQKSTDTLQTALSNLKTRHASTLDTLTTQSYNLSSKLRSSEATVERLRSALDELGGEIMKETYGRRREVALRIRLINREEKLQEGLQRWIRRSEEALTRVKAKVTEEDPGLEALLGMAQDARILLEGLDEGVLTDQAALSGSLARVVLVQGTLEDLVEELREENARRVELEKVVASLGEATNHRSELYSPASLAPGSEIPRHQPADLSPISPKKTSISDDTLSAPYTLPVPLNGFKPKPAQDGPLLSSATEKHVPPELKLFDESVDMNGNGHGHAHSLQDLRVPTNDCNIPDILAAANEQPRNGLDASPLSANDVPPAHRIEGIPLVAELSATPVSVAVISSDNQTSAIPEMKEIHSTSIQLPVNPLIHPPSPDTVAGTTSPPSSPPFRADSLPSYQSAVQIAVDETQLPIIPEPNLPHPLLADLNRVSRRYDDLQRAFRDCHLALEALKESLAPPPAACPIPLDVLNAALGRLDDYTEDARVELEIRASDEILLAKGYETLLSVPGALATTSPQSDLASSSAQDLPPTQSEVEIQVEAFISGTDQTIQKARQNFARKLEDVQHDIAALKRAIHEPDIFAPDSASLLSPAPTLTPTTASKNDPGPGWTSWIRSSPSRPSTPSTAGLGATPTFGHIMTSPRLRQSPSLNNFHQKKGGYGLLGDHGHGYKDPLGSLGLRVPMPSFNFVQRPDGTGLTSPTTPIPQRTRTVSTMYMLGLGASARARTPSSATLPGLGIGRQVSQRNAAATEPQAEVEVKKEINGGVLKDADAETTDAETDMDSETEGEDNTDVE
ncbi:hypothetical protein B0H34DRAFT_837938 [Crassisporium funariophilum]|nr:hypothetical protein B0H34DRAFT_837938 [Crassisporium funariophilum]